MVAIPQAVDVTLEAADRALEQAQERRHRSHLGMSQIGRPCDREIWYSFRWAAQNNFDAPTLKRFEDGHASELVAVRRLKMVPGIELHEVDESGAQFRFEDFGGHFSGSCDGAILGILQAPKTWHILEIKASAKAEDLDKAKKTHGEKGALLAWNPVYYAQAALYMHYAGLDRHYLVCVTPGARKWTSVRTEADPVHAEVMRQRAERIIFADAAPPRIGGPDFFQCRWCDFRAVCHEQAGVERNCRTCLHVTPVRDGTWRCEKFGHALSKVDQEAGCSEHRYLPSLVPWPQVDADEFGITYARSNGAWIDRGPKGDAA